MQVLPLKNSLPSLTPSLAPLSPRSKYLSSYRLSHRHSLLSSHRKSLHLLYTQNLLSQFQAAYPIINEYNFREYKHLLAEMVKVQPERIAIFGGLVYQGLVGEGEGGNGRVDEDCWEILRGISWVDGVQIPETTDFGELLVNMLRQGRQDGKGINLSRKGIESIEIVDNLVNLPRYQNTLRNKLLQCGYIEHLINLSQIIPTLQQPLDSQNPLPFLLCSIFSTFLHSQPLFPVNILCPILSSLSSLLSISFSPYFSQQSRWLCFQTLSKIRSKCKPNKKYSQLLIQHFEPILLKDRWGNEKILIDLWLYAARSGTWTEWDRVVQIFGEIAQKITNCKEIRNQEEENQKGEKNYGDWITCLKLYAQNYDQILDEQIIDRLLTIFPYSSCPTQILFLSHHPQLPSILVSHPTLDKIISHLISLLNPLCSEQLINEMLSFLESLLDSCPRIETNFYLNVYEYLKNNPQKDFDGYRALLLWITLGGVRALEQHIEEKGREKGYMGAFEKQHTERIQIFLDQIEEIFGMKNQ